MTSQERSAMTSSETCYEKISVGDEFQMTFINFRNFTSAKKNLKTSSRPQDVDKLSRLHRPCRVLCPPLRRSSLRWMVFQMQSSACITLLDMVSPNHKVDVSVRRIHYTRMNRSKRSA
jgi:hypothetical protein